MGFQDEIVPPGTRLAGLAALVEALHVAAPVRTPACVSDKHVKGNIRRDGVWRVFDRRYWPGEEIADHLSFALRHEPIDLLVLKRVFDAVPPSEIKDYVSSMPTSRHSRRAWFFYEKLTGHKLDLPDAPSVSMVEALDPKAYFTCDRAKPSQRHKVKDNLLGNENYCPVIRRSEKLESFLTMRLADKAQAIIGRASNQLVARAASFLLLADSKASFAIEGERPGRNRIERWGKAILQAGKNPLNQTEIHRLHRILIEDGRLTPIGYRPDGVFLGERGHDGDPMPEFIGARPDDVISLMNGLSECNNRLRPSDVDPVLQAAALAFGFVYIHPLADGNGRLHRCLIHHVLAERKFAPKGMVFPVSSVMLDRMDDYKSVLQEHSRPLKDYIEWRPTADGNVEVLNDTRDLYRFFDCTQAAEFLYECVQRTIDHDLPHEVDYLARHDDAMRRIMNHVEMPDRLAEEFIMFTRQNGGVLPRKRRKDAFQALTDEEVRELEEIVKGVFDGFENGA